MKASKRSVFMAQFNRVATRQPGSWVPGPNWERRQSAKERKQAEEIARLEREHIATVGAAL